MAKNAHHTVEELTEDAARELREFGRQVRHKANDVKKDVVGRLYEAAETIRREAREAGTSKDAEAAADQVARGLERTAHFLSRRSVEDMGDDVERAVKRSPMRALSIAFIFGLVVGLLLRGGGRD